MATSLASVPSYALPGVSAIQQPRAGLDSGDSSLATEILPGPPSLATVQQAAIRRDPRKPTPLVSYLPQHDPGTTYSGTMSGPAMGSLEALPEVDGPRRKRARVEKIHHIQRHSTRTLNASSPSMEDTVMDDVGALEYVEVPESEPLATTLESDGADASRSTSLAPVDGSTSDRRNARPARRDTRKGKQKEETIGDKGGVRVKEEASVTTLHFGEPASAMRNEDHCSACRSLGSLVYCDGCTRAYHLLCLDPPMDAIDVPEDENRWFCPSCDIRRNPRPKPPKSILSPLIQHIENTPPTEFQLPDDVRMFYKHVGSNVRGAYVDTSSIKPPRLNRLGQLEDRDPYRTRDRNGAPVLCFQCGSSAIPESSTVIAPASKRPRRSVASASRNEDVEQWKSIVSCDYCSAHWHLDCLNPPLISMPPFDKKWMCPNHVDNTLRPRHRIPKQAAPVAEVTHPGARNNGNIEVSEPQGSVTVANVPVDEVFINGRRYRVPERIIKLDFWNKITNAGISDASAMSSPLTSLSSLEDVEMNPPAPITLPSSLEIEDLRLALVSSKRVMMRWHLRRPLSTAFARHTQDYSRTAAEWERNKTGRSF
ncbi:hypothetical protein OF83DRAFT_1059805 [Amylostereum chailletii]|nr:hypothetical protein OF83DRAFT_1059805 [Amylostereum chailletii]